MHLKNLSVLNFKNYSDAQFTLSTKVNCFVGNNGVGKTNILDAVHYLALCKSFFNNIDSQNIKHDQDFSVIQGVFERNGADDEIYCAIQKNKRKVFKKNKKEYPKLADHIGLFPLVMISPADSSLIMEGGEERRRFINSVIAQYDKNYIENLLQYNKALAQRNKLLKELGDQKGFDQDILEVWNDQLIYYGEKIFVSRTEFIKDILPVFREYYNFISSGYEEIDLVYESQLQKNSLKDLLAASLRKDLMLQYTSNGIHKDDLHMFLGKHRINKTGSQGQQKTFQVALKLAKFSYIRKLSGSTPILLLDDVFDKFDNLRLEQIIKLVILEEFGQIFITDTNEDHLSFILQRLNSEHKVFIISDNQTIHLKS
jgi:DNA replication and repair protein RecF